MVDQTTMQDPSADTSQDDGSAGVGFVIEITCTADGKISVGIETADQKNAEEGAAQPAKNIKDALVLALQIYKNNGEMPEADDSDSQFSQGYGGQE